MTLRIDESRYKDQAAVTIESEALRAQFLPHLGAKMASLVYKPRGFELLVQAPGEEYMVQPFDGDYVAGECSGFDDMFPTIDMCYYDRPPWQGTRMADHGEVWSLPWEHEIQGDTLHFAVYGVRFPYRLEKSVRLIAPAVLRIDYRLTNLSPFDFDFVWAAHMMINLQEGTELVLPEGVEDIVFTFDLSGTIGGYGERFTWPVAELADGFAKDFRKLEPRSSAAAYKYFVKGRLPEGWCALRYHGGDFSLGLSFPAGQVPYLAVLPNEGGWRDYYNIFLEPCTASFDRPDAARYRGELEPLKANSTYRWHLTIALNEGTRFRRVTENGEFVTTSQGGVV